MVAAGELKAEAVSGYALIGELSLDGSLCAVRGALPLAIGLRKHGVKQLILPVGNAEEVAVLEDVEVYAAARLAEVAAHPLPVPLSWKGTGRPGSGSRPPGFARGAGDFADVAGQEEVKRALQIAAAASHNILMVGPPWSREDNDGKTSARYSAFNGLIRKSLKSQKIYSIIGELPKECGLMNDRLFPGTASHHFARSRWSGAA